MPENVKKKVKNAFAQKKYSWDFYEWILYYDVCEIIESGEEAWKALCVQKQE